jgi:hypothetical protein
MLAQMHDILVELHPDFVGIRFLLNVRCPPKILGKYSNCSMTRSKFILPSPMPLSWRNVLGAYPPFKSR